MLAPYRSDLAPDLIALWNRALGGRFPLNERLWRQNVAGDPHWRPADGLVLRAADGALAGFALTRAFRGLDAQPDLASLRGLGWIMALVVAPEYAGQGFGSQLLAAAEARLADEGATRYDLGGSIGHFLPGPPADDERALRFWARHGYRPAHLVHDLHRDLTVWTPPPPPAALREGWGIRPGRPGEEGALLDFLSQTFPGRWRYFLADCFARGYSPAEVVVLTAPTGTIAGFLASWRPESAVLGPPVHWFPALGPRCGGIGPLGVAVAARGRGLGLALVAAATTLLRERGVLSCVIDWTDLADFYARLGYQPWRSYWRCAPKAG